MPEFTVLAGIPVPDSEVLALYGSVGWTACTGNPTNSSVPVRVFAQFR